jgi:hypothetical protein
MDDAAQASREAYRIGYESALIDVRKELSDMPEALAKIADMGASRALTPQEWEQIRASWRGPESHL